MTKFTFLTLPKKMAVLSLSASVLLGACGGAGGNSFSAAPRPIVISPPPPPPASPPPPVQSENIFPVKNCINMGNALEAPYEGEYDGYVIRPQDMAIVANAGFDTIRLPVRWDTHASTAFPYTIERAHFTRVREVIAQAQAQNLNIILDLHHFEDLVADLDANRDRYLKLWEQIAAEFADLSDSVYFEPFNEPVNPGEMDKINALYAEVVTIIRQSHPTRPIILGGNMYNSVDTLDDIVFPVDDNMIANFHDFSPYEFTHQGVPFGTNPPPFGRSWGSDADYLDLEDVYSIAAAYKSTTTMPVFVGEYGVYERVPQADRILWLKERRQRMDMENLIGCAFNFSGSFALYDLSTENWKPGVLDAIVTAP